MYEYGKTRIGKIGKLAQFFVVKDSSKMRKFMASNVQILPHLFMLLFLFQLRKITKSKQIPVSKTAVAAHQNGQFGEVFMAESVAISWLWACRLRLLRLASTCISTSEEDTLEWPWIPLAMDSEEPESRRAMRNRRRFGRIRCRCAEQSICNF